MTAVSPYAFMAEEEPTALIGENYVKRRTELFARGNGPAEPAPSGDLDRRSPQERPDDHCRGLRGQSQGSARPGADRLRCWIVVRQHRLRSRRTRRSGSASDARSRLLPHLWIALERADHPARRPRVDTLPRKGAVRAIVDELLLDFRLRR